jgi:hypothetical protein
MVIKQVLTPTNLGADFRAVGTKYVNDNFVGGTAATPTAAPAEPAKSWLYINTTSQKITHYWNPASSAWVAVGASVPGIDDVLSVGQLLTANRTIDANTKELTIKATGFNGVASMKAGAAGLSNSLGVDAGNAAMSSIGPDGSAGIGASNNIATIAANRPSAAGVGDARVEISASGPSGKSSVKVAESRLVLSAEGDYYLGDVASNGPTVLPGAATTEAVTHLAVETATGKVLLKPLPVVADFWRSGPGGTVLPDGTTDLADAIVHTGNVTVGDTTAALARFHAVNTAANSSQGAFTFSNGTAADEGTVLSANGTITEIKLNNGNSAHYTLSNDGAFKINNTSVNTGPYTAGVNLVTVLPGGNVGIGTAAPITTLDVVGSFGTNIVNAPDPTYNMTANDHTVVLTATTTQAVLLPSIGQTRRIVAVVNATNVAKTFAPPRLYQNLAGGFTDVIPANSSMILQSTGSGWVLLSQSTIDGTRDFWRSGTTGNVLPDGTTDTTEFVSRTGDVAIGTTTVAGRLTVNGGDQLGGSINPAANLVSLHLTSGNGVIGSGGSLVFGANSGAWNFAGIKGVLQNGTGAMGHLAFSTRRVATDANLTEAMRINDTGRIGIGTTAPTTTLHVNSATANDSGLRLEQLTNASPATAGAATLGVDATGKVVVASNSGISRAARTSPVATAQAGTTVTLGELRFRYSSNAINGNLDVQSASASAVQIRSFNEEIFPAPIVGRNLSWFSGSAPASGATWQTLSAGGLGGSEFLNYEITTNTNVYRVRLYAFEANTVHLIAEKEF